MKTINLLIMLGIIAMMSSCGTYVTLSSSNKVSKKDYAFFTSKKTKKATKKMFNQAVDILRDEQDGVYSKDTSTIKNSYSVLYAIVKEKMIEEHKRYLRKMDWKNEFVKIKYRPWSEMPLTSETFAKQFDAFNNASLTELKKVKLGSSTSTSYDHIYTDPFMFSYIDAVVIAFMDEFAAKAANPVVKKK